MPCVLIKNYCTSHAIPSCCKENLCISCVGTQRLIDANINKNTMTTNGEQGMSIKTNIAEVHASRVSCFPLDDNEFFEWTCTNKYGRV
jgi:hypothetical protein